ncbi:hypothetical protein [Nonlabens tegetincola]|uniref:hypothetical protein n=1 Tax=Nonlabens tegetincola TaxID=323273 RepID=UPI0015E30E6B|nr:hypothetical protein [Nonlabens tegetincola]
MLQVSNPTPQFVDGGSIDPNGDPAGPVSDDSDDPNNPANVNPRMLTLILMILP